MITEHDLQEAIAECEGQRNPNANTCIKLAAFYTIKQHMFPEASTKPTETFSATSEYSYSPAPENVSARLVEAHSGTEFSQAIDGMPIDGLIDVIDELMSTLQIVQPRLYAGVMRKIKSLV